MADIPDPVVTLKVRRDVTKKKTVDISWRPLTKELIDIWVKNVQPDIDENYRSYADTSTSREVRADVGWNWSMILRYAGLHNTAYPNNRAVAVCAVLTTRSGDFPVGMLTAVPCLICSVDGQKRERGFAWYLSDAPEETYEVLGYPPAAQMAPALLDSAIQLSRSLGGDGTLLLHADPCGGDKLQDFYHRAGMRRLEAGGGAVTAARWRHKTDEYFIFSPQAAEVFSRRFDAQRASALLS